MFNAGRNCTLDKICPTVVEMRALKASAIRTAIRIAPIYSVSRISRIVRMTRLQVGTIVAYWKSGQNK